MRGFDVDRLRAAFALLRAMVEDQQLVPGAAAVVARHGVIARQMACGCAAWEPERRPLSLETLFDLASLTKIVATVPVVMALVERGQLYLSQPVASLLPAFGQAGKEAVTLRHLLTHTSGLPAWMNVRAVARPGAGVAPPSERQPYPVPHAAEGSGAAGAGREALLAAVYAQPLQWASGTEVVYSDLGFVVLGEAAAEAGGAPLDALARDLVFRPLGMGKTLFCPPRDGSVGFAATERTPEGEVLSGTVHDENARALGGVAGQAGLFSTAGDLAVFCQMLLNRGTYDGVRVLASASVDAMSRDQTHLPRKRGFGWVLQPNPFFVACDLCSPAAYSHTGFTGTSLLIDPELGLYVVLLTNRVHPSRQNQKIGRVRALFHNAVYAALE